MHTLPKDITNEISQYLPLSSQPAWRRVSPQTHESQFDWQEQCCFEPTIYEIADLLLEQSLLIKRGLNSLISKSNPYYDDIENEIEIEFKDSRYNYYLNLNIVTGQIKTNKIKKTRDELLAFLNGKKLVLSDFTYGRIV